MYLYKEKVVFFTIVELSGSFGQKKGGYKTMSGCLGGGGQGYCMGHSRVILLESLFYSPTPCPNLKSCDPLPPVHSAILWGPHLGSATLYEGPQFPWRSGGRGVTELVQIYLHKKVWDGKAS